MDELTDDAIAGPFRVYQRRRGHRYSLDDVTTAWTAIVERPDASSALDLGCGIGSVLLMVAYRLPAAALVGVEAEDASIELARRNVTRNGLDGRVSLVHGDLRDPELPRRVGERRFELVTGTPPYFPPGTATPSPDRQRAHARMELRGGVEDYLAAAARLVSPGGRVVVCASARAPERVLAGARDAGLAVLRRRDVIPRAGYAALFGVVTLARRQDVEAPDRHEHAPDLVVRDALGVRTEEAHAMRRAFDLPEGRPRVAATLGEPTCA